MIIVALILGNAILIYYLMNSEDYNRFTQNSVVEENKEEKEQTDTVANILNIAVPNNNTSSQPTVTTTDATARKTMNENLIVLYNGLILDTTKMEQTELQYIDNTSSEKDKYVITYYNYENFAYRDATLRNFKSTSL